MCDYFPCIYEPLEIAKSNLLLNERYYILKLLGQGGFGKTFLAIDQQHPTSEFCVIKQFFPQNHTLQNHQQASALFHQEALRLAELGNHPQIPQLLNTFEQDGQQYIVQEWIDGQTLEAELTTTGIFNEAEIRQLLLDLLPILQFVHNHQVIHRDIKPANIIRRQSSQGRGDLVLVDFGAAKYARSGVLEKTGTLIGSAEYAAPEQIRGKAVFASDLYSLGITCLYLLTQMSPFDLYDCYENTWIWKSYLIEPISPSLERILCNLQQPATKLRYQSAEEVLLYLNNQKQIWMPSLPNAIANDDDDFETPYFGCNLTHNPISISLNIHSVAAITIFNPQTQAWYKIPPKMPVSQIEQQVNRFLGWRLAATAATPPVQEKKMLNSSKESISFLTAIAATSITCLTILFLVLRIQSHSPTNAWKVENLRPFQELFTLKIH